MVGLLAGSFMARIHVCRWLLWRSLLTGWIADKTSCMILVILEAIMDIIF